MKLIDNIRLIGSDVQKRFQFNTRSAWGSSVSVLDHFFSEKLGMGAGFSVSKGESLIPVFACVKVISESIASMPFDLVSIGDEKVKLDGHRLYWVVHKQPNEYQSKTLFWQAFLWNALIGGNGYAQIIRDNAYRIVSLRLWQWNEVSIQKIEYPNGTYEVRYHTVNGYVDYWDMIHLRLNSLDGITGRSAIEKARSSISEGYAAQEHGKAFYENGAKYTGVIKTPNRLDEKARNQLKETFESSRNSGKYPVLEEGMDFQSIMMPFGDAQFLESRQFTFDQICALYKVPPALVSNYKDAKYANSEQMDLGYVKHTLTPIVTELEEELCLKLLSESDWRRVEVNIDMDGLLRGDLASLTEHVDRMVQNGTYNWNDGLAVLGRGKSNDPLANKRWVSSGMMPADIAAEYYNKDNNGKGSQNV